MNTQMTEQDKQAIWNPNMQRGTLPPDWFPRQPAVREDAAALIRLILSDPHTQIKSAYRVALEHALAA